MPRIAVFNKAKIPLGLNLTNLIAALQTYVDKYVSPIWGTPAKLVRSRGFLKGAWALMFLDDADVKNTLAYHDLTPEGLPMSKVFVRTIFDAEEHISGVASHELSEMLVDPAINLMCLGPNPRSVYAYENVDPVEDTFFKVDGFPMSNFVYPSYFENFRKPNSTKFDHLGIVKRPFEILPMGYQIVFKNGLWTNIFGSKRKERVFMGEDRRGHRSTYRSSLGVRGGMTRSGIPQMKKAANS